MVIADYNVIHNAAGIKKRIETTGKEAVRAHLAWLRSGAAE